MRETFIHGADDMQWLFSTHCKAVAAQLSTRCHSAIIFGNEDCPEKVLLYWDEFPLANSAPACTMVQNENGNLVDNGGF